MPNLYCKHCKFIALSYAVLFFLELIEPLKMKFDAQVVEQSQLLLTLVLL